MDNEFYHDELEARGGEYALPDQPQNYLEFFLSKNLDNVRGLVEFIYRKNDFVDALKIRFRICLVCNPSINAFVALSPCERKNFIGINIGSILKIFITIVRFLGCNNKFLGYITNDIFQEIQTKDAANIPPIKKIDTVEELISVFNKTKNSILNRKDRFLAEQISDMCVEHLILHEIAHALRGHHNFLMNKNVFSQHGSIDELSYLKSEFVEPDNNKKIIRRSIEIDADRQAIIMALFTGDELLFEQYSEKMYKQAVLDQVFFRFYSIGILFCLLDDEGCIFDDSKTYPPCYYRMIEAHHLILNFYKTISSLDPKKLREIQVAAMLEVENFAKLLNYPKGRWIRFDSPDSHGNLLEINHGKKLEEENNKILETIKTIDSHSKFCFIEGTSEEREFKDGRKTDN